MFLAHSCLVHEFGCFAEHAHPSPCPSRRPAVARSRLERPPGSAHGPCPVPQASGCVTRFPHCRRRLRGRAKPPPTLLSHVSPTPGVWREARARRPLPSPGRVAGPERGAGPGLQAGSRRHNRRPRSLGAARPPHAGAARSERSPMSPAHRPVRLPARQAPGGLKSAPPDFLCGRPGPQHLWVGPDRKQGRTWLVPRVSGDQAWLSPLPHRHPRGQKAT